MKPGQHRDQRHDVAERYGKHSQANAHGLPVTELLRRAIKRGEAVRLAWSTDETNAVADESREFPTAVLPAVRDDGQERRMDEGTTEPTTATREARKWFEPGGLEQRPLSLAG